MLTTAVRTSDFTGGLGVNTHLSDTLGPYGNLAQVEKELGYVGIGAVRDSNALSWSLARFAALASNGVKLDLVVPPNPGYELGGATIQNGLDMVAALLRLVPGSVIAIEGQNEPWQFPDTFNGVSTTNWSTVAAVQDALHAALRTDAALTAIPLLSPSLDPTTFAGPPPSFAASADLGNAHVYPWGGNQPLSFVAAGLAGQQTLVPGRGAWITEFGYSDTPGDTAYGVDDATQAKNTLNGLLDAFKLGAARTFLYELNDEASGISPSTAWGKLGLFNADGTAKPVAVALHNLTSVLADGGAAQSSFTPGALDVTVTGLPASGSKLLLEKSSGVFELVLWNEAADWNPASQSDVAAAAQTVSVGISSAWASVAVYDPLASAVPIATYANAGTVQVALTDHPVVIEITPAASVTVASAAPTTTATVAAPVVAATPIPVASAPISPVFRFFDSRNGTHFFTTDATEAQSIVTPSSASYNPSLIAEQNGYGALTPGAAQTDPQAVAVFRLFDTRDGTHFFTADAKELAAVTDPGSASYRPDLVLERASTFYEHSTPAAGDVAIYRFFDSSYGTHFYTSDRSEVGRITTPGAADYRPDLKAEGISFYAPAGSFTV